MIEPLLKGGAEGSLLEQAMWVKKKIDVAPWLAVLADSTRVDRFKAYDLVKDVDLAEVEDALVKLLSDKNLKLAYRAHKKLKERTKFDLPLDEGEWRRAIKRRDLASGSPQQPE